MIHTQYTPPRTKQQALIFSVYHNYVTEGLIILTKMSLTTILLIVSIFYFVLFKKTELFYLSLCIFFPRTYLGMSVFLGIFQNQIIQLMDKQYQIRIPQNVLQVINIYMEMLHFCVQTMMSILFLMLKMPYFTIIFQLHLCIR